MEEQTINNEITLEPASRFKYFPFFNKKQPVFVLALIGFIFYCSSLDNEYALDDGIVIHQNNHVLKGVAGIKDIMTHDLYHAFYRRMNAEDQLQGGRYHPLPIVSFAIEQEFIGAYRTGYYLFVEDLNRNGKLDAEAIPDQDNYSFKKTSDGGTGFNLNTGAQSVSGKNQSPLNSYEYNDFWDLNGDGKAQENECNNCWDLNKNFHNDAYEDLNKDGIFNEVDCQVNGAFLRHFNNLWLYILAAVLLYLVFSRYFFKENPDLAFLAALIFLAHPVHSEVVANVKGRDEIFAAIFMALTFLFSFKFMENKKTGTLLLASFMFLLALLSKEYAIMLLLLIPVAMQVFKKTEIKFTGLLLSGLCFFVVFLFMIGVKLGLAAFIPDFLMVLSGIIVFIPVCILAFRKSFASKELNALMMGLFTFSLLYIGLRLNAVSIAAGIPDKEILNDPYLLANGEEKFATKIFILLKYLVLAVFPKNLTSDYSYDSIPYKHFTDPEFIISLLLNLSLIVLGWVLVAKRHVMGFAIITYYAFLLLVTNFIFSIGASMHEGCLFHASIGIAIAFAWLIITGFEKLSAVSFTAKRSLMLGSLAIVIILFGCKTWERNRDWKNDVTLFLKDVKTTPNSVLVLGNAGARWIDLADTKEITGIVLEGEDPTVFNDYNGTLKISDEELKASGFKTKREAALDRGIGYLKHAVELHPSYVNGYLNLGLASFKLQKDRDAIFYWKIAEHLYPDNPYLSNYYRVYTGILKQRGADAFKDGKMQESAMAYNLWTLVEPGNAEAWYFLGGAYFNQQKFELAEKAWVKSVLIDPHYEEAKNGLKMLQDK
ncbi:MAG TPA: glycosyltransferase family 39 protein [Bacteroidia bacterium]|nr:glycosyltransferase family 39 protein [Bacteroidia bacterium]